MTLWLRETENGEESVSTVAWFPLFSAVLIICSPETVLKSPLFISSPYTHNTHTLLHSLSPDGSPSLPSLALKKTFPGKNETALMTPLSHPVCLFLLYHVGPSPSHRLFFCVIYCVFLSHAALCCLFIDCERPWMNCEDWLQRLCVFQSEIPHAHTQHYSFVLNTI